jgi:hypothetical protein
MTGLDRVKQKIQEIILTSKLNSTNSLDKFKEVKPQEPEK